MGTDQLLYKYLASLIYGYDATPSIWFNDVHSPRPNKSKHIAHVTNDHSARNEMEKIVRHIYNSWCWVYSI
jgi:hypothetical protein